MSVETAALMVAWAVMMPVVRSVMSLAIAVTPMLIAESPAARLLTWMDVGGVRLGAGGEFSNGQMRPLLCSIVGTPITGSSLAKARFIARVSASHALTAPEGEMDVHTPLSPNSGGRKKNQMCLNANLSGKGRDDLVLGRHCARHLEHVELQRAWGVEG